MNKIKIFDEPYLEFAYNQKMHDPHDGLSLFGPYDKYSPSMPKKIKYGVIGTRAGIDAFNKFCEIINKPIYTEDNFDEKLWPHFPGFEAIFDCVWPVDPIKCSELTKDSLLHASLNNDPNKRAYCVANEYVTAVANFKKKFDEDFNILFCIVPEVVWQNCRPNSTLTGGWDNRPSTKERESRAKGQVSLFPEKWSTIMYKLSVDFRRQLKARVMKYGIPIQILRESTLQLHGVDDTSRSLTSLSDRAWNLSTAAYYKVGGKPWKLSTARDGVCYIGIAFRRVSQNPNSRSACCAAQMFLDTGDGIVFLGDEGPWYSPENNQFHLKKEAARDLLKGILETYKFREGKELKEIFLHYRSSINEEEFDGFKEACPKEAKLIGIRVRTDRDGIRFYREGKKPVMRGTFYAQNERGGFLFCTGYKPSINTYDGWEVPVPLRIDIQYGDASIEQVSKDIFGLTKLNYNACKLGDSEPVTIMFSDAVGEILVSNPGIKERDYRFKFYI